MTLNENGTFRSAEINPFRVSQLESIEWIPSPLSVKEILEKWKDLNYCGQIIGEHGSGKTTLALKLQESIENEGLNCLYLFANNESLKKDFKEWDSKLDTVSHSTIVIFDGIEQAGFWSKKRWLTKHKNHFLLTHSQLNKSPLVCKLKPTETLFIELCEKLAGAETSKLLKTVGGPKELLRRHHNNLRDCFFELYKLWQHA
jgi:hypothetical protein